MVDDLYQETILDHSKRPRNCHAMDDANHRAEGYNPLCGDKLKLYLKMEGDIVQGRQLRRLRLRHFHGLGFADDRKPARARPATKPSSCSKSSTTCSPPTRPSAKDLGKLVVFCGVRDYPARVKCATLAWHTLKSALEGVGRLR